MDALQNQALNREEAVQSQDNDGQQQRSVRRRRYPVENDERHWQQSTDGENQTTSIFPNVDDVTQSILTRFIADQMENDGYNVPQRFRNVQDDSTECEVALHLRKIGDFISKENELENFMIGKLLVTPKTAYETFQNIAAKIFQDGNINWGRIAMLFYLAYKLAMKVVCHGPLMDKIIKWTSQYVIAGFLLSSLFWYFKR